MNNKFLYSKITIRIIAILLAVLLWFYVITEQNPIITKEISIPIQFVNRDYLDRNEFVLMDSLDINRLSVVLKGKKNILDNVSEAILAATADLSGVKGDGENHIPVSVSGIPIGINSFKQSLSLVKVYVEPRISENRTVSINVIGAPASGLAAMKPLADPADVIITGPASLVGRVISARVDIDITGFSTSINQNLSVRLLDEDGNDVPNVKYDPLRVNVAVPIAGTKRVPILFDVVGNPAANFTVSDTNLYPRDIFITGKPEVVGQIESIKTERVDIAGAAAPVDKEVSLIIPLGVELVNKNDKVRINIDIEEIITKTVEVMSIEIRNQKDGLVYTASETGVTLNVRGVRSMVDNINEYLKLFVDAKTLVEGITQAELQWEKNMGLQILDASPQTINIEVKKSGAN